MALSRAKYKRLPDLYVAGTEVVLKDGTVMWLQVLNPFEIDEARHDAQVARSRLVMALQQHGSDEMRFVESQLYQDGIEEARKRLVQAKTNETLIKTVDSIRDDPEWTERLEILNRSDDDAPLEDVEKQLLEKTQGEYLAEITKRIQDEEDWLTRQYADATTETLKEEYTKLYIERRGNDLAAAEFRVVEIWYGARVCEGVQGEDGTWSHDACESHQLRIFDTKAEVRSLPAELGNLLGEAYDALSMSQRDAKDLARPASSSDSSRRPSAPEESTPSTPDETPASAPGTSSPPSLTLSPS